MRTNLLSLTVMLLCGAVASQAYAQPPSGAGNSANAHTHANTGLGNRPSFTATPPGIGVSATAAAQASTTPGAGQRPSFATAQGQGAVRAVGQGNSANAASVGAQFKASGAPNASGIATSLKTRGTTQSETHGLSLHSRARQEIATRGRERMAGNSDSKVSGRSNSAKSQHASAKAKAGGDITKPVRGERNGTSTPDSLLANRLASIDHMRDIALKNGNERMLDQADKLEALARQQYQRRTGEFAEQGEADASAQSTVATSSDTSVPESTAR